MKLLRTIGTLSLTSLLATTALALEQNIKLPMDAHLRGHQEVPLKRLTARQGGRDLIRGWNLDKVTALAKSKHGQGKLSLLVGNNETLPVTVAGTPESFHAPGGNTLLSLNAPHSYGQRGPWKIFTQGNIKIADINLKLSKQLQYDYTNISGMRFQHVAGFKAQKIVGSSKTISVNGYLNGLAIVGTKRKVIVNNVKITFMDGQVVNVNELTGKLKSGHTKGLKIRGILDKPIKKIKVSATSYKPFGSRGALAIKIAR